MSPAVDIGHLGSIGSDCVRRRNGGAPRLVVFETWDARQLASEGVGLIRLAVVVPASQKPPLLAKSARNGAPRNKEYLAERIGVRPVCPRIAP